MSSHYDAKQYGSANLYDSVNTMTQPPPLFVGWAAPELSFCLIITLGTVAYMLVSCCFWYNERRSSRPHFAAQKPVPI